MANRFPLVVDSVNLNIKELPSGDNLDLTGSDALFGDNDKIILGASSDLQIYHNGSNSYIQDHGTGDLIIAGTNLSLRNFSTDELFFDGTANGAVRLWYDGSAKLATTSTGIDVTGTIEFDGLSGTGSVSVTDILDEDTMSSNSATALATQQSIKAYVDATVGATNEVVEDTTPQLGGNLDLNSNDITGTGNINNTGTITTDGLTVDGNATINSASPLIYLTENDTTDLNTRIRNAAGNYQIHTGNDALNSFTARMNISHSTGDVSFYEDTGTTAQMVWDASADALTFGDNVKATFGAGSDLQIYHDVSNSFIDDSGVGELFIRSTNGDGVYIYAGGTGSSNKRVFANSSGSVDLYYGSTARLATTSTGIDVTGTVTADGLNVDSGGFTINTAGASLITSTGSVKIDIDSDNNATDNRFLVTSDGNTNNRLQVGENGDISFYEDTGTTAKLFWDASAESLGIGTSSPDTQLTLYKASTNADVNYAKMRMDSWGGSTGKLKSIAWDDNGSPVAAIGAEYDGAKTNIHFHSQYNGGFKSTSDRTMSIMGNGNVGIGTSSPTSDLSVGSTATSSGDIALRTTKTAAVIAPSNTDAGGLDIGVGWVSGGQGPLTFSLGGAEKARIDSSGRLNVGQTSAYAPTGGGVSIATFEESSDSRTNLVISNQNIGSSAGSSLVLASHGADYFIEHQGSGKGGALTFTRGTSEAMRIDSSGNLLVGRSTAGSGTGFEVNNAFGGYILSSSTGIAGVFDRLSTDGEIMQFRKDGTTVGSIRSQSGLVTDIILDPRSNNYATGHGIGGTQVSGVPKIIPRDGSGNALDGGVDLGHSNSRFKNLYLSGDVNLANNSQITFASTSCNIEGNSSGADFIKFTTASSEAARIDSSGNLLVGTTSALAGNDHCFVSSSSDTTVAIQKNSGAAASLPLAIWQTATTGDNLFVKFFTEGSATERGNIDYNRTGNQVRYNVTSDQRLKENIVAASSASDDIDAIKVRQFDWIENGYHQSYGLIAQELLTVVPDAVNQPEDPEEMMGVDYSKLVPMMLKEIQSLRARVAELEEKAQ